ncbi:MAG: hypothetical protein EPN60_03865 [Nevskiaceae bacterium]|nr:MAG: hypothetical protein EPO48_10195 [Nevskiaceae bacterium]TAM32147.1 MAG: hypothetical protein EPN60_03865 [Nevskiaceae bacterium]
MLRPASLALLAVCTLPLYAQDEGSPPSTSAPTPVLAVPVQLPGAPGEVPLANPAPAAADAPLDSVGATPPSGPKPLVPAANRQATPVLATPARVQTGCSLRDYGAPVERGQIVSAIFNTCSGVSLHKANFILPFSYSPRFPGDESEFIFQISGKAQLWDFGPGAVYFGYSQRSYFQIFNEKKSKAFRESDYNPELFVRLPRPLPLLLPDWSLDAGFEHESNGQDLPDSRSYNRLFFAPYWTKGRQALQLKTWWRIPEDDGRPATDPKRDDNPDLGSYYGYGELRYRHDLPWNNQLIEVMLRGNATTGRGAVQVDYSLEVGPVGALFLRVFNGYGESLIDYNRSVTRVALGVALQR